MASSLQIAATRGIEGKGNSVGAEQRRARSATGTIYSGRPGDTIKMSDRYYFVRRDGSFRRILVVK